MQSFEIQAIHKHCIPLKLIESNISKLDYEWHWQNVQQ